MDRNICKKCGNKLILYSNEYSLNEYSKHYYISCSDPNKNYIMIFSKFLPADIYNHIRTFFKNKTKYVYNLSCFKDIEADKSCPYYVEHELSRMNEQ